MKKLSTLATALGPSMPELNAMTEIYLDKSGKEYIAPARKELGVISIPVVREIIAPAVFRQEEPEPLTAEVGDAFHVRAVANKFKYGERARALQILRSLGLGGWLPQNRALIPKGKNSGDYLDLSSFLFGESANTEGRILSSAAAVKYSCALSTQQEVDCTDQTFHIRLDESGTLYDAINKKNSDNLFERIYVKPGTLMVQVLTITGKVAPAEMIEFLLACLASPMASGGQTSVSGVNVRTHIAGVFSGDFEQAINSPYILLPEVLKTVQPEEVTDVNAVLTSMYQKFSEHYPFGIDQNIVATIQADYLEAIGNRDHEGLKQASEAVSAYYTSYFDGK